MENKILKIISFVLCCIIILPMFLSCGSNLEARTVTVMNVTGANATMKNNKNKESDAKEGMKLSADYGMTTGMTTYIDLKLDESALAKMDERSEISVSEISSNKLKIDLLKGAILVNERGKQSGSELEVNAGNAVLAVRGTFFTARYAGREATVYLVEGEIEVTADRGEPILVEQGKKVTVGREDIIVDDIDYAEIDDFTRGAILEYIADLSDALSDFDIDVLTNGNNAAETENDIGNSQNAVHLRGNNYSTYPFNIVGASSGSVWGSDVYTDDSVIAVAAVHAGLVEVGQSATVTIRILPGRDSYPGVTRNGITTSSWGSWDGSYEFVR